VTIEEQCLDETLPLTAADRVNCLRRTPGTPTSPFSARRLGLGAAGAHLPRFRALFDGAFGAEGAAKHDAFVGRVAMPPNDSGYHALGEDEFALVRRWALAGMPHLDELLSGGTEDVCVEEIPDALRAHVRAMATDGWAARHKAQSLRMFGCDDAEPLHCLGQVGSAGPLFPLAETTTYGATWPYRVAVSAQADGAEFHNVRVLRKLEYATSFWTRSSPDGRFAGGGRYIADLQSTFDPSGTVSRPTLSVSGSFDPAFFPNGRGFAWAGTSLGVAFCPMGVLTDLTRSNVTFNEPGCVSGTGVQLYEHVGVTFDEDEEYFVLSGNFSGDSGGHGPQSDPSAYFSASSSLSITRFRNDGSSFAFGATVGVPAPLEGDGILAPSASFAVSRIGAADGIQRGYRVRMLDATPTGVTLRPAGRLCLAGGKASVSFDERFVVVHHYVTAADWKALGFASATDPGLAEYTSQGAANVYLVDLLTGKHVRVTHMAPGQFALYPHFRADGWLYFLVRSDAGEVLAASDVAIRMARTP
jgi:hypothetical protein